VLDDDAIARYARQIVVPGIGASGQEKLLRSLVFVAGHARGRTQAALYLRAAGAGVLGWLATPPGEKGAEELASALRSCAVVLVAEVCAVDEDVRAAILASGRPVCWYAIEEPGFTGGVHPQAPMPPVAALTQRDEDSPFHDVAACDAASAACAVVLGLPVRPGPFRFRL
jgi:hypothetical protein